MVRAERGPIRLYLILTPGHGYKILHNSEIVGKFVLVHEETPRSNVQKGNLVHWWSY